MSFSPSEGEFACPSLSVQPSFHFRTSSSHRFRIENRATSCRHSLISSPSGHDELDEGLTVIRQAISCDICGAEKKQTNHWFVAYEQGGELRVSGWNSRNRLRGGSKHLCGQACLHKLADDFMARIIGEKAVLAHPAEEVPSVAEAATDTSLAQGSHGESAARLMTPAAPLRPFSIIPMRERAAVPLPAAEEEAHFETVSRRAEAWERERERAAQSAERRTGPAGRKLS